MNRVFEVDVRVRRNEWAKLYHVVAPNMPAAIKKAIARAKRETLNHTPQWRCVSAIEQSGKVI